MIVVNLALDNMQHAKQITQLTCALQAGCVFQYLLQLLQLLGGVLMACPHGLLMGTMLSAAIVHGSTARLVRVVVVLAGGHMDVAIIGVVLPSGWVRHQRCRSLVLVLHNALCISGHPTSSPFCDDVL